MNPWIVQTLVSSTLLMLAVLAVRRPFARAFGPRLAYALWALPALRLLLPSLPGWRALFEPVAYVSGQHGPVTVGIVDAGTAARLHEAALADAAALVDAPSLAAPTVATSAPPLAGHLTLDDLGVLMIALWAVGALLWFGWQLLRYRGFLRQALADATLLTRAGGTDVLLTPAVAGPMAAGVLHRRIFLPVDFRSRYSAAEQRLALLHEGAHHDRGDLIANFAGLAVVALHWWNPIAHWAWRAFRADQELACDATVLAGAEAGERLAYGSAVLKSACTKTPTAACAMNHKSQLKQRIGMMKDRKMGSARLALGCMVSASMVAGGLLLTASGTAAQTATPLPPLPPAQVDRVAPAAPTAPAPVAPVAPVAPAAPHKIHRIIIKDGAVQHGADKAADDIAIHHGHAAGDTAKKHVVRMIVMKDGKVTTDESLRFDDTDSAMTDQFQKEAGQHRIIFQKRIEKDVQASMADVRRGMAAKCEAAGTPMPADADMGALATCGPALRDHINKSVRESLRAARASIEATVGLGTAERQKTIDGIDRAMRDIDRDLAKLDTH